MTLVSNRIVDAVSLKIQKLGGLRNALAAARICEAGKVKYRLGAHAHAHFFTGRNQIARNVDGLLVDLNVVYRMR